MSRKKEPAASTAGPTTNQYSKNGNGTRINTSQEAVKVIPAEINIWSKEQVVDYYIDELKLNLVPLKPGSKELMFTKAQSNRMGLEKIRSHLKNGANIGCYPTGCHVIIDLDSKPDDGASVTNFINNRGRRVHQLPRERTHGGVHLHLLISDLPKFSPEVRKLVCKINGKVSGELFFGSREYVVISPSIHTLDGRPYQFEVTGEMPEWCWRDFTDMFGEFKPEKEARKEEKTSAKNQGKRARALFKGDLSTLNLEAILTEAKLLKEVDLKDEGKFIIVCPFEAEHTEIGKNDKGTAAWAPKGDTWPGFNCFHSHCAGRNALDYLEEIDRVCPGVVDLHCAEEWRFAGDNSKINHGRVRIQLPQEGEQDKPTFVQQVGEVLEDKEEWFTRNNQVIRIDTTPEYQVNSEGIYIEARERLHVVPVLPEEVESLLDEKYIQTGVIRYAEMPDGSQAKTFKKRSIGIRR